MRAKWNRFWNLFFEGFSAANDPSRNYLYRF